MITFQVKDNDCFVDDIDSDLLQYTWSIIKGSKKKSRNAHYLRRDVWANNKRVQRPYLHRVIMARVLGRPLLRSEEVDHEDGNGLNNKRDNLRIATRMQNSANKGAQHNNKLGVKGVSERRGGYVAVISVNKKRIHLGDYKTIEEAKQAYDEAAKKYFGDFSHE